MKEPDADHPVQSAGLLSSRTSHADTAPSKIAFDDPCLLNPVLPMLYVAAAAVTDVVHTSRRLY